MDKLAVKYDKDIKETDQNFKEQTAFICSICLLEMGCKVGCVILFSIFLITRLFNLTKLYKRKMSKLLMLVRPFFIPLLGSSCLEFT